MQTILPSQLAYVSPLRPMQPAPLSLLLLGLGWADSHPAGLDRYVYDYSRELLSRGHHVELCGVGLPDAPPSDLGIQFTNLANPKDSLFWRFWQIRQVFRNRSLQTIDAINLHFALYSLPVLQYLPPEIPITFTFHGPWFLESQVEDNNRWKGWVKHWLEQRVYNRCDHFIVLSNAFGEVLHNHYQVPAEKIHVIPGGVDLGWFKPPLSPQATRTDLDWPQDRFILFTARRFVKRMGLEALIQAVNVVRQQHPDVLLLIAGKGPLAEPLARQVQDLDLDEHVKFLGFIPDQTLKQCYQGADLTVMPSQDLEGFGLVVVESLACGTPVLCTPVGGMQEIIEPLASGLITPSRTSQDIASHLMEILGGRLPLPSRLDCRNYAENRFNWAKITHQIELVLTQG